MRINELLFVHIAKTAGLSLHSQLTSAFGEAASIRFGDFASVQRFQGLSGDRLRRYRYITGHIPLKDFRAKGISYPAITVIRKPIDRLVSMYRYLNQSDHPDHVKLKFRSFEHFAEYVRSQAPLRNDQCEYIGGSKTFGAALDTIARETLYVVPLCRFGDMVGVLSALLPRPITNVHLNKSREGPDEPDPGLGVRGELERYLEADIKLYEAVTRDYPQLKEAFLERLAGSKHVTA